MANSNETERRNVHPPPRPQKRYDPPRVHTLTSENLLDAIGPAQAFASGTIEPPHPERGTRRHGRH